MKKWLLTCSTDGNLVDYDTIIESEEEPGEWECRSIAVEHGCDFWTVDELEED